MKQRPLGRTGLNVSEICLGTMTWGRQNTEAEGHEQMDYALDQGINFFDTAELYAVPAGEETYGKTEEIIGSWFAARKNRDEIILASKIAGPGPTWIRRNEGIDRKNILEALEGSLRRLQTDYIDLYQLHFPNRGSYHFARHFDDTSMEHSNDNVQDNLLEVLETLNDQVRAGKIRHVGLSNETAWGTMEYLRLAEQKGLPRMASIQNEYNLLCRLLDWDLAEVCLREDVGLLAYSPLAFGTISGKYLGGARPEGTRWAISPNGQQRDTRQAEDAIRAYIAVAEKHGLDVCQMAIAWTLTRPFLASSIIGATSMEQLKTNIAAANLVLSEAVLQDIEAVRRDYPVPF